MRSSANNPYIITLLLLLPLLLMLAYGSDWQYDEAWTYNGVSSSSVRELICYQNFQYANHQLLNSLYFKVLQEIGAKDVLHYRWLSVLSFLVFSLANLKIFRLLQIKVLLLPVVLLTTYFIFFSLGRGYGPAIASLSLAILFLNRHQSDGRSRDGYLFVATGILATLSVFSFVYPFGALVLVYAWSSRKKWKSAHLYLQLVMIAATLVYVYYAGNIINSSDPYIIGSETLFFGGTLSSIGNAFTGYPSLERSYFYFFIKLAFILLLASVFIQSIVKEQSRRHFFRKSQAFVWSIPVALILMIMAHHFFDAKYPLDRAVLYMPYLILVLLAQCLSLMRNSRYKIYALLIVLFGLFGNTLHLKELSKPSLETILKQTEGQALIISGHNPNVRLTNQLCQIKSWDNLHQSSDYKKVNALIASETDRCFVLVKSDHLNAIHHPFVSRKECRDNMVLLEIAPTP